MSGDFTPLNALEQVLADAQAGTEPMETATQRLVEAELMLLAATGEAAQAGDGFRMDVRRGGDGALYAAAFTAQERLPAGTRAAGVRLRDVGPGWPAEIGLVIAPGLPIELALPPEAVRSLSTGAAPPATGPFEVPAGTSVMLGDPAEEPEAVLRAVAQVCRTLPQVATAARAQMLVDRPGEVPQLVIGLTLDGAEADAEAVLARVGQAATDAGSQVVSVVVVEPAGGGDGIAAYLRDEVEPFYERSEPAAG